MEELSKVTSIIPTIDSDNNHIIKLEVIINHQLIMDLWHCNDNGSYIESNIGKNISDELLNYAHTKGLKMLPIYVELEKTGTALRLIDNVYFRDMGGWSIGYKIENGQLYASVEEDKLCYHFNNQKLIEITEEEWKKDNSWHL